MYIREFIAQLKSIPIDDTLVSSIQEKYECILFDEAKFVVSFSKDGYFFDDDDIYRILTSDEITMAPDELHVDFIQKRIIPVIDSGDNNFIVIDCEKNIWCMFNIVDESRYRDVMSISEFFR